MEKKTSDRHWLTERFSAFSENIALAGDDGIYRYRQICDEMAYWQTRFESDDLAGKIVILNGDFSARAVSALLVMYIHRAIVVPLHQANQDKISQVADVVQADLLLNLEDGDSFETLHTGAEKHSLIHHMRDADDSGLILLSSGSTGVPKAMLLSMERLIAKHAGNSDFRPSVTAAFLLFDHIGGFNTMIHCLCHGGTLVHLPSKTPEAVCRRIEHHRIELLPTTPTFLNMLLISQSWKNYDLSSLKMMTYGTEVMPKETLASIAQYFPQVRLKQTYGMSELGILATRSQSNDSLWVKIGGDGVEVKVVDNVLWVKSPTAMLGYLNYPSPFDEDGWLCTQDVVEVDGDYFRILGRQQEIINVAGLKVLPIEVEECLLASPIVAEASVWPKKNPVTGFVVAATITLHQGVDAVQARSKILTFCREHLADWQIPRFIRFSDQLQVSERFKKIRESR